MAAGRHESTPASTPNEPHRRRALTRHYAIGIAAAVVVLIAIGIALKYRSGGERRRYETVLKSALDKIVTAQEGFYYDSTRYTTSLRALPNVHLPTGVHVQIFNPDRGSWWGIATHDQLPARHCIVWVGTAPSTLPQDARAPEDETKPLCFGDPRVAAGRPSHS